MISKLLGGFITIQSEEGYGSTFSFHLKITNFSNLECVDVVHPRTQYVYTPCELEIKEEKIEGSDNSFGKSNFNDIILGDNKIYMRYE